MDNQLHAITLRNPVIHQIGTNKAGQPVYAYAGELEDTRITLYRPIRKIVGKDANGADIEAWVGITAQKTLETKDKRKVSNFKPVHKGIWQDMILDTFEELKESSTLVKDFIEKIVYKAPGQRHRSRFMVKRAIESLVQNGDITIKDGIITKNESNNFDDLI